MPQTKPQPVVVVGAKRDLLTDVAVAVVAMLVVHYITQPRRR